MPSLEYLGTTWTYKLSMINSYYLTGNGGARKKGGEGKKKKKRQKREKIKYKEKNSIPVNSPFHANKRKA